MHPRGLLCTPRLGEKTGAFPVTPVLGVVAVKGADLVRRFEVAAPAQVLLHRSLSGASGQGLARVRVVAYALDLGI